MKKMYISELPEAVMINFAKRYSHLIKGFNITSKNQDEFFYICQKVGTYRVVKLTHGAENKRNCAKFVFRDYTCNLHGNVVPSNICLNQEWREEMLIYVENKRAYVKEFNTELDKELAGLKEDYEYKKECLESQRLYLSKAKVEEVEEM